MSTHIFNKNAHFEKNHEGHLEKKFLLLKMLLLQGMLEDSKTNLQKLCPLRRLLLAAFLTRIQQIQRNLW